MQTSGGRAAYRERCRHVSPRFRLLPHPRLAAVAAVAAAAAVAESSRPRRTTPNPPSATHGEGAHDYIPIAGLQLLLYFPASAGIPPSLRAATPSPSESSDDGDTAALPAAHSVGGDRSPPDSPCAPRSMLVFISTSSSRARLCSNILAHEAAPGPTLRASARVFASPVQSALLPDSPRIDGIHVLIIGLPQGRGEEEWRD